MSDHKGSLSLTDGTLAYQGTINIEEFYEPRSVIPTLIGSFILESPPQSYEDATLHLALSDGRKADICISNVAFLAHDRYEVTFHFSSTLR
jgi:hypothetical protein